MECDVYSAGGAVVGAGTVAVGERRGAVAAARNGGMVGGMVGGWRGVVGVVEYLGWRYGVKRGEWEEVVAKVRGEVNPGMPVVGKKGEE